jgi:hypothetical protein
MADKPNLPQVMPAGGQVVAVVPQSIEEIFRVAKGVVQSGLAPYALTGKTDTVEQMNKATSAVAIVIMAGAELGLPPMVALRSFTAINGRPALYGDGLINVVRRSKQAKKIEVGFMPGKDEELGDDARGYCFAIRADTGEEKRVEFSVRQAKRAGLWQDDPIIKNKEVWEYDEAKGKRAPKKKDVPNDSPWYRYPERMLGWRAAGFCLRELFGDVLGGITDDWEVREIAGMIDVSPAPSRPEPPDVPEEPPAKTVEIPPSSMGEKITEADAAGDYNDDASGVTQPDGNRNVAAFLTRIDEELSVVGDAPTIEEVFDGFDLQIVLAGDDDALARAFDIKKKHLDRVEVAETVEAGQKDMFGGEPPDVPGE